MNSKILEGEIFHHRVEPRHQFRYPYFCFALDLDELEALGTEQALFGHNRSRPVAFYDRDYLDGTARPLKSRLLTELRSRGFQDELGRVVLVTAPRVWGHAFNPVSFYFCYSPENELVAHVAEVNNTFGERHLYLLTGGVRERGFTRYEVPKAFFVSPFYGVEGDYFFLFSDLDGVFEAQIRVLEEGELIFHSQITGELQELSQKELARLLLKRPLTIAKTLPRIHWEAARLFFGKKVTIKPKPGPWHRDIIRTSINPWQKLCRAMVFKLLQRARRGKLTLHLPDHTSRVIEGSLPGTEATMTVNNWDLFIRLVLEGDVALGDGYVDAQWDTDCITSVIRFFIENRKEIDDRTLWLSHLGRAVHAFSHRLRNNSIIGSKNNIQAHYDLGNALFERFLDKEMMYSCALYAGPEENPGASPTAQAGPPHR